MITIVVGDSDIAAAHSELSSREPGGYTYNLLYIQHPRQLLQAVERIADKDVVVTNSLFLIREIYMKTERENIQLRYAYKGAFYDELPREAGILEADLEQSERYLQMENSK